MSIELTTMISLGIIKFTIRVSSQVGVYLKISIYKSQNDYDMKYNNMIIINNLDIMWYLYDMHNLFIKSFIQKIWNNTLGFVISNDMLKLV